MGRVREEKRREGKGRVREVKDEKSKEKEKYQRLERIRRKNVQIDNDLWLRKVQKYAR